MGDYNRSTVEINFAHISPDIMQAVHQHIETHNFGDILNDVTHCIVSTSEKIKKGLFGGPGPKLLVETAILTNRWLILADQMDAKPVHVRSMQLRDLVVEDYEKSSFHSLISDTGLSITGRFTDVIEQGMIFLPLGKDQAGDTFKEAIIRAVQEAKK